MTMKILIDNGHGLETKGKRSPDQSLIEAQWTRQVANLVHMVLARRGYDVRLLVPEDEDISLTTRANRANYWCGKCGAWSFLFLNAMVVKIAFLIIGRQNRYCRPKPK